MSFIHLKKLTRLHSLVLALLLLSAAPSPRAEWVEDIDVARIGVTERSGASLRQARRAGLAQVLVKISGTRDSLQAEGIAAALRDAQRFLVSYSYEERDEDALFLRLEYDGAALRQLLRDAGQPLWTANRPTVLSWLVVDNGERRRFASREAAPELHAALQEAFAQRGVPLQQPLYDLEDVQSLSPGAAWRQSSVALGAASARYGDAEILAGRGAQLTDGSWLGEWRFLDRGRWRVRPVSAGDMQAFVAAGVDLAAAALAGRYAVTGDVAGDLRYSIHVTGIDSYAAYSALQTALAGVEAIDRVVPARVSREEVVLRVESAASQEQLARILALDGRFAPQGDAGQMHYRWGE